MPTGEEFSKEMQSIMFRVSAFVDSEKNGVKIPLNNVVDRLCLVCGLSRRCIASFRQEMSQLIDEESNGKYVDAA
jgi:hypothetical protein